MFSRFLRKRNFIKRMSILRNAEPEVFSSSNFLNHRHLKHLVYLNNAIHTKVFCYTIETALNTFTFKGQYCITKMANLSQLSMQWFWMRFERFNFSFRNGWTLSDKVVSILYLFRCESAEIWQNVRVRRERAGKLPVRGIVFPHATTGTLLHVQLVRANTAGHGHVRAGIQSAGRFGRKNGFKYDMKSTVNFLETENG